MHREGYTAVSITNHVGSPSTCFSGGQWSWQIMGRYSVCSSRHLSRQRFEQKCSSCTSPRQCITPMIASERLNILVQPSQPHVVLPSSSSSLGGKSIGNCCIDHLLGQLFKFLALWLDHQTPAFTFTKRGFGQFVHVLCPPRASISLFKVWFKLCIQVTN